MRLQTKSPSLFMDEGLACQDDGRNAQAARAEARTASESTSGENCWLHFGDDCPKKIVAVFVVRVEADIF